MKEFSILTLFPEAVSPYTDASILKRGQEAGLINIKTHQLRNYATNKHNTVDDTPYGGGAGMVMMVEPIDKAVQNIKKRKNARIILTSASGKRFTQQDAKRLTKYDQLIFICGRYEGVDHRVEEHIADESLSIGDYVLTGGELPALVMTDAIARLIPGVLGSPESLNQESHSQEGELEYPQYTNPETYTLSDGTETPVPEILLSGHHKNIKDWREKQTEKKSQS